MFVQYITTESAPLSVFISVPAVLSIRLSLPACLPAYSLSLPLCLTVSACL